MEFISNKTIFFINRTLAIFYKKRRSYRKARWEKKMSRLKNRFPIDGGFGKKPKFR